MQFPSRQSNPAQAQPTALSGWSAVWRKHPEPDWKQIHRELQTHKDLTLQPVWQEGRESNPDGYAYSRFCELYRRWLKKLDLVLRQEHRAGEKMFVDYAGATIPVYDRQTGDAHPAAIFVAVLGASSYTFAEATTGQDLRNWIGSHKRALEFFGGVVEVVVPDNLKSAVTQCSRWRPRSDAYGAEAEFVQPPADCVHRVRVYALPEPGTIRDQGTKLGVKGAGQCVGESLACAGRSGTAGEPRGDPERPVLVSALPIRGGCAYSG